MVNKESVEALDSQVSLENPGQLDLGDPEDHLVLLDLLVRLVPEGPLAPVV